MPATHVFLSPHTIIKLLYQEEVAVGFKVQLKWQYCYTNGIKKNWMKMIIQEYAKDLLGQPIA